MDMSKEGRLAMQKEGKSAWIFTLWRCRAHEEYERSARGP